LLSCPQQELAISRIPVQYADMKNSMVGSRKRVVFVTAAVLVITLLCAGSFRRSDMRTLTVSVPGMADSTMVRIVTNAALDEVVAQYDGVKRRCEIDLAKRTVLYHEGNKLLLPEYRREIRARLRQVGFESRVLRVALNPPLPLPTPDGPVQVWPDRYTLMLHVPGMTGVTAANRVVDAIAYARLGGDHPGVTVDREQGRLTARYESLRMAAVNIEHAIACAGFSANDVPANLGGADAVCQGWSPVEL
jgi:hypothetical protein